MTDATQHTINVVTHYDEDDKEFSSDHSGIEVFVQGEKAAQFSDSYHESTQPHHAWLQGFEFACKILGQPIPLIHDEKVADGKWIA